MTEDWRADALCAQIDPELFFPEKGGSTGAAKKICHTCDVREQCLTWALANGIRGGIYGGKSDMERLKDPAYRGVRENDDTQARRDRACRLAEAGRTDAEIAIALDISDRTAARWVRGVRQGVAA